MASNDRQINYQDALNMVNHALELALPVGIPPQRKEPTEPPLFKWDATDEAIYKRDFRDWQTRKNLTKKNRKRILNQVKKRICHIKKCHEVK